MKQNSKAENCFVRMFANRYIYYPNLVCVLLEAETTLLIIGLDGITLTVFTVFSYV